MNDRYNHPDSSAVAAGWLKLGIGSKTPYPAFDGATLELGPSGLSLIVSLPDPVRSEIRTLKRGTIDVGMIMAGGSAIVLWRFGGRKRPMLMETPFHIGLLPPDERWIPTGTGNQSHNVLVVVQDQRSICRALRLFKAPVSFSRGFEKVVAMQDTEASRPGWSHTVHERAVDRYFRTFPDTRAAMAACDRAASSGGSNPVDIVLH